MPKKSKRANLPRIFQRPSGSWSAKVYDYTDAHGKDHYRSFTDPSYEKVLLCVVQFKADKAQDRRRSREPLADRLTLGEAMDRLLEAKRAVWSPTTYRSNRAIRQNNLKSIEHVRLSDLTAEQIQMALNEAAMTHSPKTVRNINGFLSSVLAMYRPGPRVEVTLPQRIKRELYIPDETEVSRLLQLADGTDLLLPILLAAFCGMRRSEIAGLKWSRVDFARRTISIREVTVRGITDTWVSKTTKTESSDRTIRIFPQVYEALEKARAAATDDFVVHLTPNKITERFSALCRRHDIPHHRFHDLRHFCVSVMVAQGIPLLYIVNYVGHKDSRMVTDVYNHFLLSVKTKNEDIMEEFYRKLFSPDPESEP